MYNHNQAFVPEDIVCLSQVLQRILLHPEEEANVRFFSTVLSDPVHLGSIKSRFGAVIGIPAIYNSDKIESYKENLTLRGQTLDWDSPAGQELVDSLQLSDQAKAFVIAREIYHINSYYLHVDYLIRSLLCTAAYCTANVVERKLNSVHRLKLWASVSIYLFVAGVTFLLFLAVDDSRVCWLENSADRRAAKLNKYYATGGVEYYNKALARNKALRKLMGSNGLLKYTAFGNDVSYVRQKHVLLTTRRDNLVKYSKQYES